MYCLAARAVQRGNSPVGQVNTVADVRRAGLTAFASGSAAGGPLPNQYILKGKEMPENFVKFAAAAS